MPYPVGTMVRVTTIGKVGRVVSAARGGRYHVLIGAVQVACRERDLEVATGPDARPKRSRTAVAPPPPDVQPGASQPERARLVSIDLHGATVDEALRTVQERLDEALRAGLEHLDIVHGRGSGRVRRAVHRLLQGIGAVRHFELLPDNPGVTRVYF